MLITTRGEYGIMGISYLASQKPGKTIHLRSISKAREIPEPYLAKIFQAFTQHGLLRSRRGAGGGFSLARPPEKITLREVLEAVEGPIALNRCLSPVNSCSRQKGCSFIGVWKEAQKRILSLLEETTLADLVSMERKQERKV